MGMKHVAELLTSGATCASEAVTQSTGRAVPSVTVCGISLTGTMVTGMISLPSENAVMFYSHKAFSFNLFNFCSSYRFLPFFFTPLLTFLSSSLIFISLILFLLSFFISPLFVCPCTFNIFSFSHAIVFRLCHPLSISLLFLHISLLIGLLPFYLSSSLAPKMQYTFASFGGLSQLTKSSSNQLEEVVPP